jgi:PPOX class probable F420-dependent enzyme
MLSEIPAEAREIIESDALAHLVTVNADGSPQVSCVWVGLEGGELAFASLGPRRKLDNIRRDPRVVVSLEGTRIIAGGLKEYLVVHGRARVQEGEAPSCCSASPTPTSARKSSSRRWTIRRRASWSGSRSSA